MRSKTARTACRFFSNELLTTLALERKDKKLASDKADDEGVGVLGAVSGLIGEEEE